MVDSTTCMQMYYNNCILYFLQNVNICIGFKEINFWCGHFGPTSAHISKLAYCSYCDLSVSNGDLLAVPSNF